MAAKETRTRLLFIRHGERDHDVTVPSNALIPLTFKGHEQATVTGKFLASEVRPTVVYSSPFLRCLETSQRICEQLDINFTVLPSVCELLSPEFFDEDPKSFHLFYNMDPDKFAERFPRAILGDVESYSHPPFPETVAAFAARIKAAANDLVQRHPGETIVCVAHGGFLEYCAAALSLELNFVAFLGIADFVHIRVDSIFEGGDTTTSSRVIAGPLGIGHAHLPPELVGGYACHRAHDSTYPGAQLALN